jgi:hypothetical protein
MKNRLIPLIIQFLIYTSLDILVQESHAQCFTANSAFQNKEEIRYAVSYNWGPVWVDAGLVTFSATLEPYMGKTFWHFKGTGKSYPSYDLFFKVRDYFDAYTDPETFKPYSFRRYVYEGGYSLLNTLDFNYNTGKVFSSTKIGEKPPRMDTLPVTACGYDMLSAIYYTRTIDFSQAIPGWKKDVKVIIDDHYYDIVIRFLGRETVESPEGKRYSCIKFAAKMVQGTIFKGDEDVLVWVTDDQNKIPVYIEAKIIVGTVKAYLKDYKNLRDPRKY